MKINDKALQTHKKQSKEETFSSSERGEDKSAPGDDIIVHHLTKKHGTQTCEIAADQFKEIHTGVNWLSARMIDSHSFKHLVLQGIEALHEACSKFFFTTFQSNNSDDMMDDGGGECQLCEDCTFAEEKK